MTTAERFLATAFLAIVGLIVLMLTAPLWADTSAMRPPPPPVGRYRLSTDGGQLFLLDTTSGRLWRKRLAADEWRQDTPDDLAEPRSRR